MGFKTCETIPGVRSVAVTSVRTTTILTSKKIMFDPRAPLFVTFLVTLGKKLLDQNDVEFDFRIVYFHVTFQFL